MSGLYLVDGLDTGCDMGYHNFKILSAAADYCKKNNLDEIILPSGTFEVYNEKSLSLESSLINAVIPADDYYTWKNNRNVLLDILGFDKFTIKGNNTTLLFSGLIAPIDFTHCGKVSIENMTFDWKTPLFSTGEVLHIIGNQINIRLSEQIPNNAPIVSFQNYDKNTNKPLGTCIFSGISNVTHVADNEYFFTCSESFDIKSGASLILRHIYSYAPVLHFFECSEISVLNVTINSGSGMGIIAHSCKNAYFNNLNVIPSGNRPMSTNCDATHFISCYGKIKFTDCSFEAMGDDAVNIHGFYLTVTEIISKTRVIASLVVTTQDFIPEFPSTGDKVEFVKSDTLRSVAINNIKKIEFLSDSTARIDFEAQIPDDLETNDCIANVSKIAELEIQNSSVKNIRGRAALIQTHGAKIENCLFEACTGQGIHIDTATGWMESIGTRDIEIRNNKFLDCGYGSTKYCDAVGIVIETECSLPCIGIHKNILIKENYINGNNTGIKIASAENVQIIDNFFENCEKDLFIEYSKDIKIHGTNKIKLGNGCENESIKLY